MAWTRDGSALVVTDGPKLLRLDVPSGVTTELDRAGSDTTLSASWGETGRIVVNDGMRVRILGNPQLTVRTGSDRLSGVSWSLSGSALVFSYSGPLDDCVFPNEGFAALVPGQKRRVLIRPNHRQIVRSAESPDGRFLAVDLSRESPASPSAVASAGRGPPTSNATTERAAAEPTPRSVASSCAPRAPCAAARAGTGPDRRAARRRPR